jgi:peptidoglycan-binding protein ArfA
MAGSDEAPETTKWRRASKFYRRPLGLPWLIGLVVIPLLLGVIGYGEVNRSRSEVNGPTGALPTLSAPPGPSTAPAIPALSLTPVSITRSGNSITLHGDLPSTAAKAALVDALKAAVGPDVNIVDNLRVNPDVNSLDFSNAGAVFKAAASISDFNFAVKGDTITLSGTAGSGDQQDAVEQAAYAAWPNLNIVDTMGISGSAAVPGSPGPAPGSPAPAPAPGAPAPRGTGGAVGACSNLQADITALGPITFALNGSTLTPAAVQTLNQVVDKLKACSGTKVMVKGYADNTGDDAINIPLSENRADAVVDFLIAKGVTRDHMTAKGFGSADPVADNGSLDGQAKNRRVEIAVN